MPSASALGRALSLQMPPGAHVIAIGAERLERNAGDICVRLGAGIEMRSPVADRGVRHAQATVEPRSAAKAAEHRNRYGGDHRGPGLGAGMPKIEQGRPGRLEVARFAYEFRDRSAAVELGEYRDPASRERSHGL